MRSSARIACVVGAFAAAAPPVVHAQSARDEVSGRVSYSEGGADDRPRDPSEWVELMDPTPARHGTMFAIVGADQGEIGLLRLDAATGRVMVRRVRVVFSDGDEQVFTVNRAIDRRRHPVIYVNLGAPRSIDQIVVTTDRSGGGTYAIHGSANGDREPAR